MNTNSISVDVAASTLLGAGLSQIGTDLNVAMMLIGTGVALKLLLAVLHKNGIEVNSQPLG